MASNLVGREGSWRRQLWDASAFTDEVSTQPQQQTQRRRSRRDPESNEGMRPTVDRTTAAVAKMKNTEPGGVRAKRAAVIAVRLEMTAVTSMTVHARAPNQLIVAPMVTQSVRSAPAKACLNTRDRGFHAGHRCR